MPPLTSIAERQAALARRFAPWQARTLDQALDADLRTRLAVARAGRQVPGAKVGMSAVLGLGANGASVILKI